MKKKLYAGSVSHDQKLQALLAKDSKFATEYLRAAIEVDDDPHILLIALRRIAEARGGITHIARKAGIERESLHRALSARGNPTIATLSAITKAVGLRLTVEPV